MRVIYLEKRWEHHTQSGGYHALASAPSGKTIGRPDTGGSAHRFLRLVWRSLARPQYLVDYRYEDCLAELNLIFSSRFGANADVVHVLYGDEQLNLLLQYRLLLRCPLVATFHLPPTLVEERFTTNHRHILDRLDMAIVVSRSQIADFERWFGPDRVAFVPHGIDTEKFCPGASNPGTGPVRILTVGENMRDWESLHRILDECSALKLNVGFDVVTRPDRFAFLTGCRGVRLHANISEEELIALYRGADVLLLPLLDATANNALLESLACGTPVISTDVGGIRDYVDQNAGWLLGKGDVADSVRLIERICGNRDIVTDKRKNAREEALQFDWRRIRAELAVVYETTMRRRTVARSQ